MILIAHERVNCALDLILKVLMPNYRIKNNNPAHDFTLGLNPLCNVM